MTFRARRFLVALLFCAPGLAGSAAAAEIPFTFESNATRPLALSPDGTLLFATNTPGHTLEIFAVEQQGLVHQTSVLVGLDPVAVAARTNDEVWVVNKLSDSVSVVDVAADPPRVVRTLQVGDEPHDVVFGGPSAEGGFRRAFVTTARRGQNSGIDPMPTVAGTPRALVYVFDVLAGAEPEAIVELFGDSPRALAVSPDGSRVFAAIFHSGNRTTSITEGAVCNGGAGRGACDLDGVEVPGGLPSGRAPGGLPAPNSNFEGAVGPETGIIVRFDEVDQTWRDDEGRNWTNAVRFNLPDYDVFEIDALAAAPSTVRRHSGVGTLLFNMIVNPENGKLYVTNTEARNEVRFEGLGALGTTVRGHLHEARITVVDGDDVLPRHLNKHILEQPLGYATMPMPESVRERSLATPLGMAISSTGTLYVAAFGSSKIGIFDPSQLESGTFVPSDAAHIEVSGGGPTGLVLDESHDRIFVLTRFDNSVKAIRLSDGSELGSHPLIDPEHHEIREGRRFLYDARLSSSTGEASCAACHAFADFDSLAWDLGNPEIPVLPNPNPFEFFLTVSPFHPMKGPMTTQTLRGMDHHGPMHWRGDRTAGNETPPGDPLDEKRAFESFNEAFGSLLGLDEGSIPEEEMEAFADFILRVQMPPNPYRRLDNQDTAQQAAGRSLYFGPFSDGVRTCNGCHVLSPSFGFFGTDGDSSFENEPQLFKIAQLSNVYTKVGMFGMPDVGFIDVGPEQRAHQGDQVRGFGMLHDGSVDTVFNFLSATVFFLDEQEKRELEDFVLGFPATFAPIVGQQVTLTPENIETETSRSMLLVERAIAAFDLVGSPDSTECDLVVSGVIDGVRREFLLDADGRFQSDRVAEEARDEDELRNEVRDGATLTYTCFPPGWGERIALDRDGDGFRNRDEIDFGTDPLDEESNPGQAVYRPLEGTRIEIHNRLPDDERKNRAIILVRGSGVRIPVPGSFSDPRCLGQPAGTIRSQLRIESTTSGKSHSTPLPCENWRLVGSEERPRGYRYRDRQLEDGTVLRVVWQEGKVLKIVLSGKGPSDLDYDLRVGEDEGEIVATLTHGLDQVCLACNAEAPLNGVLGRRYRGDDCPAPARCLDDPASP